jgi:hypothetical protein
MMVELDAKLMLRHDCHVFLTGEVRDERLGLLVEVECAVLKLGSAHADAIRPSLGDIGATATVLNRAEVII